MATAFKDPRINHPPRLSDLHGDDRRKALIRRDGEAREAFMARYREPIVRRGWLAKVLGR